VHDRPVSLLFLQHCAAPAESRRRGQATRGSHFVGASAFRAGDDATSPRSKCLSIATAIVLLVVGACARQGDERTVVRFWAMGFEGQVVAQLIPEFERRHPGIRVELQQLPWTAAHEKLLTAFAGDSLPDVCALGNTWVP